jgi:hypothetical protein
VPTDVAPGKDLRDSVCVGAVPLAYATCLSLPKIPSVNLGTCELDRRESLPQRLEVRFAIEHA